MRLTQIGISFLLIAGTANAIAGPSGPGRDGFNTVRAYHTQGFAFDAGDRRGTQQMERESDRRRGRETDLPDSSGYSAQADAGSSSEGARKQARLSPEERRALRRQIDEAGQDIYTPKR